MKKTNLLPILILILAIALTACSENKTGIEGEWLVSDGSYIIFTTDNFHWARDEYELNEDYYAGPYEYYRGEDAITYLTENGFLEFTIRRYLESDERYSTEEFVCLVLQFETFVHGTIEEPHEPYSYTHYGFIWEEDTQLWLDNIDAEIMYTFFKQEKGVE